MKTKTIKQNEIEISVLKETAELYSFCKEFADTIIPLKYSTELLVEIFNTIYMRDLRDYYSREIIGRSNWTQHSANTFLRTCQLLDYPCDFEVENRHDGALRNKEGEVFLCAEWEMDEKSIFTEKGEINKLIKTCKKYKNCEAMLFAYNIRIDEKEFIKKVYDQWNENQNHDENKRLFLITAIFEDSDKSRVKFFKGLRTFVIAKGTIDLWEDLT